MVPSDSSMLKYITGTVVSQNRIDPFAGVDAPLEWNVGAESNPALQLNTDRSQAIEMSKQLNEIAARLPGLDCGSCGSPSCKALAEDIVRGDAYESDCIFKMKERIQDIFRSLADMEHITVRDPEKRERDEKGEDRT